MKASLLKGCSTIGVVLCSLFIFTTCEKGDNIPTFTDQGTIGQEGGIVKTPDGASVEIPAGALQESHSISISKIIPENLEINTGYSAYEIKPDGLTFNDSITITLPFDDTYIETNLQKQDPEIKIAVLINDSLVFLNAAINITNRTAQVKTNHFSDYYIFFRSQWDDYFDKHKSDPGLIIAVPYYQQEGNWCFYYSLSMILKQAGYALKAPFLASLFNEGSPWSTGFEYIELDPLKIQRLHDLDIEYEYGKLWPNAEKLFGYLLSRLKIGKPVQFNSIKQGHAIVVIGHDPNGLYVNDPNSNLMEYYPYDVFKTFWLGTKIGDWVTTLSINSTGDRSNAGLTINFRYGDLNIKSNPYEDLSVGELDIDGKHEPNGYSLVNSNDGQLGTFDGSSFLKIEPKIANSYVVPMETHLHLKIDNKDISNSPQVITISETKSNFHDFDPLITQLCNLESGEHDIKVELRSSNSIDLFDSWEFKISIGNPYNVSKPEIVGSSVNEFYPYSIKITFNMSLANIIPDISAFHVSVNSISRTVNSISISGMQVGLTLSSPIYCGDIISVSYSKPTTNLLQTTAGLLIDSFTDQPVANNVTTTNSGIVFNPNLTYGSVSDIDGNVYKTIQIGTQTWMAENLRYLPSVVGEETSSSTNPNYYVYGYNGTDLAAAKATSTYQTYGVLYNWPAAMSACPTGWHLPSEAEWIELLNYLGGRGVAGGKLKETGTTHWSSPNTGATNETGFTALPGGYRNTYNRTFYNIGNYGNWWSASEYDESADYAWFHLMYYNYSEVSCYYSSFSKKEAGLSVRCIKD